MVGHVRDRFKSLVQETQWMDNTTKSVAQSKLDAIKSLVGYPDWIANSTALDSYYDGVSYT